MSQHGPTQHGTTVEDAAHGTHPLNTHPLDESVSDFDKKYPPDAYGEEMSDTARVWTVYRDQASEYDGSRVDSWNKTLDILLIFAGLFSAVATTFIGESYHQLQTDWNEYTGRLLFATLAAQTTPGNFTLPAGLQSMAPSEFSASRMSRLINGLWVTSLVLGLAVALLSILAKQWLVQFESRITAPVRSTRDWAHRHVLYTDGLKRWHFAYMIAALPALLHLSLVLFLTGLALFFWPLDRAVSAPVVTLTAILVIFYFSTIFLSYRHRACPFYIAWFTQVHRALSFMHKHLTRRPPFSEAQLMEASHAHLSASVLTWLATYSPEHEVNAVAVYAIGTLRSTSKVIGEIRKIDNSLRLSLLNKIADLHEVLYATLSVPHAGADPASPAADDSLDDDALSPLAYNYLRVGHAANCLDLSAEFSTATRRSDRGTTSYSISSLLEHVSERVPWLMRSCPGQMLCLDVSLRTRTSDDQIRSDLVRLERGLRDRDWTPHATHIAQTLEQLLDYSDDQPLPYAVALRLVHCSLADHYNPASLQEHLSLLSSFFPGHNASIDRLPDTHIALLSALHLYSFIVEQAVNYSLGNDVSNLVLSDLTHISRRLAAVGKSPQPRLAALIASGRLQDVEWDSQVIDAFVTTFATVSRTSRPPTYVSGLSVAIAHLISKYSTVGISLLERDRSVGNSCWASLCTCLIARQRSVTVADSWGLVSCASALCIVLGHQTPSTQSQQRASELFSIDFLSPALDLLTTEAVLDSLPDWEKELESIVCGNILSLAPDSRSLVRDAMHSHASEAVRKRDVWIQFAKVTWSLDDT